MCLAGKKEQIMFSQQHWKTPENALITFIFINWGIIIHFTTNWSLGAPEHTSSEVIIIQLQINLNSKIQLYGLGTNEID